MYESYKIGNCILFSQDNVQGIWAPIYTNVSVGNVWGKCQYMSDILPRSCPDLGVSPYPQGLTHLIGSPLLRAYMHGFFMDIRLYHKVTQTNSN